MAGKTLDVSILVRLVDRITGPLSVLQRKFAGLAQLSQRIGILGAAAASISFAVPLASAAAFDQQIRDSVVTMGQFGQAAEERIAQLGASYQRLALLTGVSSAAIAAAAGILVSSGVDDALTAKLLPTIARVSKAASAATDDVAQVAFSLSDKFGISAADMELALAKLVTAGKLGRFEFKNMAKELPELTSQYSKFGVTGMRAVESIGAALQVAMFGTNSPNIAANNFKNFLSKLLAPETIKNFEKFGVDIKAVMQDAAIKGINPIEAAIEKVSKLTGMSSKEMEKIFKEHKATGMTDAQAVEAIKAQITKIGGAAALTQVFGDMQVLDFMLPMLQNLDRYKQFKAEIAASGLDVIAKDFATQFAGLTTQIDMFGEVGVQVSRRVGLAFAKNLPWLNVALMAALRWVAQIDERWPGAIDTVLTLTGAFLALVVALAALGPVMSIISAGLGVIATVITALASPFVLLGIAIAAAAAAIIYYWDDLPAFFSGIWRAVSSGLSSFAAAFGRGVAFFVDTNLAEIRAGLSDLTKWLDGWTGGAFSVALGAIGAAWNTVYDTAKAAFDRVKAAWSEVVAWIQSRLPSLPDIGAFFRRTWGGEGVPAPADQPANPAGDGTGWSAPGFAPPVAAGATKVGGEIVVRAEPGTEARVQSDNPTIPLVQDRGPVLSRP